MKARNAAGTTMAQVGDIASDLDLHIGAGDGASFQEIAD
jgi:hypothetical protein